ncbi:MAG: hypothetical protein WBM75_08815 [Polyangiales bacterium]
MHRLLYRLEIEEARRLTSSLDPPLQDSRQWALVPTSASSPTYVRRDNVPPGRISVLLLKTPRGDEEKHLERMGLRRLSEDDVPRLGRASLRYVTWSIKRHRPMR